MEQELQIPSCLFGGPPVRDDMIKLGESQIGFMNIFARPLFEAVADILPAMQYTVDEMLANKTVWEKRIAETREKKRKQPNMALGRLAPGFALDPSPSPLSGSPLQRPLEGPPLPHSQLGRSVLSPTKIVTSEEPGRRDSNSSAHANLSNSRRSSLGIEKGSRRSSATGIPGVRSTTSQENQSQSRRGSGDASLTAILVTQGLHTDKQPADLTTNFPAQGNKSGTRKDTLTKHSPQKAFSKSSGEVEKGSSRPVTAPSSARRSQGKTPKPHKPPLYPLI